MVGAGNGESAQRRLRRRNEDPLQFLRSAVFLVKQGLPVSLFGFTAPNTVKNRCIAVCCGLHVSYRLHCRRRPIRKHPLGLVLFGAAVLCIPSASFLAVGRSTSSIDPELFARANAGDLGAQEQLADDYEYGEQGAPQDPKQAKLRYGRAVTGYRKLADKEDAVAQFRLDNSYSLGHGVPMDEAGEIFWYSKAAARTTQEEA
jgi:TPR repeat protein